MRIFIWLFSAACVWALNSSTTMAQQSKGPQQAKSFKGRITKTVRAAYWLYLPKEYEAKSRQRWPLILFLHGSSNSGARFANRGSGALYSLL